MAVILNNPIGEGQGIPPDIEYFELENSPRWTVGLDETVSIRNYRVAWERAQEFAFYACGFAWTGAGILKRWLPMYDPQFLSWSGVQEPYLFASRCRSITGFGQPTYDPAYPNKTVMQYEFANVEIQYDTVPYDVKFKSEVTTEKDRYVVKTEEYDARYLTVERGTFVWDEAGQFATSTPEENAKMIGQEVGYGIGIVEAQGVLDWTWFDVPAGSFSRQKIREALGHVNGLLLKNKEDDDDEEGYPPETILLLAYRIRSRMVPIGGRSYEISFRFGHQPLNWNKVRAPDGYVKYVKAKGSDPPLRIYDGAPVAPSPMDFKELFLP